MRTRILVRTALTAAIVMSAAVAGCGGSTEPASSDAATGKSGDSAGKSSDNAAKQLRVGDETTIKGLHGPMKVTILKIQDPLPSPPPRGLLREIPQKGNRFVGVQVRLTNLGNELYDDSLLNGSRLTTDVPKGAQPTILLGGKCKSKFGTNTRIPAGATKTGCLPFQVKKKAKVTAFDLTLNSGYGPETSTWAVR